MKNQSLFELLRLIESEKSHIRKGLPDIHSLTDLELMDVIIAYSAIFEHHFLPFMAKTFTEVKSERAREIIKDNLLAEIQQNHPLLLKNSTVRS